MTVHDLAAFIRARLDEEERVARTPPQERWSYDGTSPLGPIVTTGNGSDDRWTRDGNTSVWTCDDAEDGCPEVASQWEAEGEHIARHDPARVLAEVEAKRRILDLHAEPHECPEWDHALGETCTAYVGGDECPTLRLLALPCADHPDYDEAWRP